MIETLLPDAVVAVEAEGWMWTSPLLPEEEACVRDAAPRRRREFAAGRACARLALERLGLPAPALGVGPDRAPLWPAGTVGSISHCRDYCAAAVAREDDVRGLGIDAETAGRITPALAGRILRPEEDEGIAELDPGVPWPGVLFSAKEAFYKCYVPLTGFRPGFRDVAVEVLDPEGGRFAVELRRADAPSAAGRRRLHGRFALDGPRILAAVVAPTGDPGR